MSRPPVVSPGRPATAATSQAPLVFAVVSAVLMGTIGVFAKLSGAGAEAVTFARLFLGACFMLLFLGIRGQLSLICHRPSRGVLLNGGFLAGFILFYVQAMNYTTMANAIMIIYLAPLAAAVYAHFFMRERITLFSLLLIFLALFGFAMMLEFNLDFKGDVRRSIGLGLATIGMFCYAGFILVNRTIREHPYSSTFYQLFIGSCVVAPFFFSTFDSFTPRQLLLLAGAGLFPGFLAILLAVLALRSLRAATFGTLAYFEPLAVVLFGWAIFQETLTPLQIGGCLLILASGILKTMSSSRDRQARS